MIKTSEETIFIIKMRRLDNAIEETYDYFENNYGDVPKEVQDYGYGLIKSFVEAWAERTNTNTKIKEEIFEKIFSS